MPKLYMGLFCHGSHDAAVALVDEEGRVVFAAEQERYDRVKHSSRFPEEAIRSALLESGASWSDIESVAFAWDPYADLTRIAAYLARHAPRVLPLLFAPKQETESRFEKWSSMRSVPGKLRALGWEGRGYRNWNHHLCHAASSFFPSGFDEALCLTVDGNGEFASTTIHERKDGRFRLLHRVDYPHSLGHFYATLTQFLGFKPLNDEYKVMGLAAFRRNAFAPKWREAFDRILRPGLRLDLRYFSFHLGRDRMWSSEMETLLGAPRAPGAALEPRHEEIASAAQDALERSMLGLSQKAKELAPRQKNLCLAGGVALNCVANERLMREGGWNDVFILPAPHDSGSALGAAYLAWSEKARPLTKRLAGADLGASLQAPVAPEGPWRVTRLSERGSRHVAELLASGKTVGWARGRSEFGPRALGSRSLLADPRNPENKEKLNRVIKRRESFRPFAPVVLAERARDLFDLGAWDSPFMLRTVPVLLDWKEKIPAALHVDGSARVQTLTRDQNPALYGVIEAFEELTGVPVLLNTSFNTAEEPIANDANHALAIFQRTAIDALVLDDWILEKN